jgi:hypothetical protein
LADPAVAADVYVADPRSRVEIIDTYWRTALAHRFSIETSSDGPQALVHSEYALDGIHTSRFELESVAHVSGTICHLCLELLIRK